MFGDAGDITYKNYSIYNCPTRYNTKQSIYYSASSLYMFRVSPTPIIRMMGVVELDHVGWR